MSRKPLTEHQISLLIKGPKFCPSTKGNYLNIKADIKEYTRKLKLKDAFHGQVFEDENLVRKKSNSTPKTKNQDLTKIIDIIEKSEPIPATNSDNLARDERKALLELKNDKEIVIKKADK